MKALQLAWMICLVALSLATAGAAAQTFTEGEHYTRVAPPPPEQRLKEQAAPQAAPGKSARGEREVRKVEVREFFWYGCPHCYTLEPRIQNWNKPADIEFVMTPAVLGKDWVVHAYTYYALKDLGKLETLHPTLFAAIHGEKRQPLRTAKQLAKFFDKHGLDKDQFQQAMESFSVDVQVKRAERMGRAYGISSVPTFVVGKQYMTSPSMTGSYESFFKVVDYLVERVRQSNDNTPKG